MQFSHPLARGAKVWPSVLGDQMPKRLLVIVTTLELAADHKRFKKEKVDRLHEAATEWLTQYPTEAEGYLLMNRFKDWFPDPKER